MIRRLSFGFVIVLVTAFIVAACGRQVTPNPAGLGAGGAPPGFMAVIFDVQGLFNFQQYQYMVVFNTSGSGVTPSTDTLQTNWNGYNFAIVALGNGATSFAEPVAFLRNSNPHISPAWVRLGSTPQTFSYNLNNNGTGTEFSILARTAVFSTAAPSPSPTPASVWKFNAFTAQASSQGQWTFFDSMGAGGPIDPQFVCCNPPLDMTQCFDNTYFALNTQVSDPAAQIVTIQISNTPLKNPCSS
ncbi:MAG: hypothetical protein WBE77_10750 [Candidatus Cybelea sp.]